MRVCDSQVGKSRLAVACIRRSRREGQLVPLAQSGAQDGIHEPARARFSCRPRQSHRIVDDRRRRHTIEMKDLIEAQAQDVHDLDIELRKPPLREMLDQMVEAALPPQCAGDNLRRQRTVALIGELLATHVKRRGQIRAA